ncbi:MAG: hypothetical protein WD069_01930 [Planctomycetales bacterium]
MPFDPYGPCPCGSGKKLKFCCQPIADEMEKALRLHRGNQLEGALKALDALAERQPNNPWVVNTRASILFAEARGAEAVESLQPLVEAHPENLLGLALLAAAVGARSGFVANKPLIHRAFQRCAAALPDLVARLVLSAAFELLSERKVMAARQHLVFALRVAPDEERNGIFQQLVELDAERGYPFPIRSVHLLVEAEVSDELKREAIKAAQVAERGCYGPAGVLFARCAEKAPESAALWHNVGLCRAWDGDEAGAAEALHQAARLERDFDKAVELETLAQLLHGNSDPDPVHLHEYSYRPAGPVARILTILEGSDRLVKNPAQSDQAEAAGVYELIDRPLEVIRDASAVELGDVSRTLGQVKVLDADAELPARIRLTALGPWGDEARRVFAEIVADEAVASDGPPRTGFAMPREWWPLYWAWRFHPQTPRVARAELVRRQWRRVAEEIWPKLPLDALGGRTPDEAAHDPAAKAALAAAVVAFDAYCDTRDHALDVAALRRRLDVPPPGPLAVDERTPLNRLTAFELERLPLAQLADAQLSSVLNRETLIHRARFLREVLLEALRRPACASRLDLEQAYTTLYSLAAGRGDRADAAHWLALGKDAAAGHERAFEHVFEWEFREFTFRVEDPSDPDLPAIAHHLSRHYGRKIPNVRTYVQTILRTFEIDIPLEGEAEGDAVGSAAGGGLWTPEGAAAAAESKKLWLPGQE